jgi:hypothetical protein
VPRLRPRNVAELGRESHLVIGSYVCLIRFLARPTNHPRHAAGISDQQSKPKRPPYQTIIGETHGEARTNSLPLLPDHGHTIGSEGLVRGRENQVMLARVNNQQAVERIAVVKRKFFEAADISIGERAIAHLIGP